MNEVIEGLFVKEQKNRFLCEVLFPDGLRKECYIPSSCKLSNFVDITGKKVYLQKNRSKSTRTQYKVVAVETPKGVLPLELGISNKVIEENINTRRFSYLGKRSVVLRECNIGGYKCDLFIPKSKTIIEIKSILCLENNTVFPLVYSERAVSQLKKIHELIQQGYKVEYMFVSLSNSVSRITINKEMTDYYDEFCSCVQSGMTFHGYSLVMKGITPQISKRIDVSLN